jgi:hypothetical protein
LTPDFEAELFKTATLMILPSSLKQYCPHISTTLKLLIANQASFQKQTKLLDLKICHDLIF